VISTSENNFPLARRLSTSSPWKHKTVALISKDASMHHCHADEVGMPDECVFEGMSMGMDGPFVNRIAICFPILWIVPLVEFVG